MKLNKNEGIKILFGFYAFLVLSVLKIQNNNVQLIVSIISIIGCIVCGVYFYRKGSKITALLMIVGVMIGILGVFMSYLQLKGIDYKYLILFAPLLFILLLSIACRVMYKYGTKRQYSEIRVKIIFLIIVLAAIEVFLMYLVFFYKKY